MNYLHTIKRLMGIRPAPSTPEMINVYLPKQTVWVWVGAFTGFVEGRIIGISKGLYTVETEFNGWIHVNTEQLITWENTPVMVEGVA